MELEKAYKVRDEICQAYSKPPYCLESCPLKRLTDKVKEGCCTDLFQLKYLPQVEKILEIYAAEPKETVAEVVKKKLMTTHLFKEEQVDFILGRINPCILEDERCLNVSILHGCVLAPMGCDECQKMSYKTFKEKINRAFEK